MEAEISTTEKRKKKKEKKKPSTQTEEARKKDCGSNLWRLKLVQLGKKKKPTKQGRKIVDLICGGRNR